MVMWPTAPEDERHKEELTVIAPGFVASERMLSRSVESPFWTGPLRSPARLQNTFAHECFMDEIAALDAESAEVLESIKALL